MIQPLIIGYSGVAGSGKDEAASITLNTLQAAGVPVVTYSFAYPLKEICKFVFDMTEEELTDRELKESIGRHTYGMTNRKVMQLLGTESFRDIFNENIWIDTAERNILKSGGEVVVISDVRFENEAKWVKENGLLFHIDPTGREGFETISASGHASEAGYETEPTLVIPNNASLEEFQQEVMKLVETKVAPLYGSLTAQARLLFETMQANMREIKAEALSAANFGG